MLSRLLRGVERLAVWLAGCGSAVKLDEAPVEDRNAAGATGQGGAESGVDPRAVTGVQVPGMDTQQPEARRQLRVAQLEPDVGPLRLDQVGHLAGHLAGQDRLARRREKHRQRHTPRPLARNTPVRPRLDRARNPVAPPRRQPLDPLDLLECLGTQPVDRNEKLLHRTEDDRRLRTPAVRVRMPVNLPA